MQETGTSYLTENSVGIAREMFRQLTSVIAIKWAAGFEIIGTV